MRKVVILRPGALGDVLAVRGVVRFFRDVFPGVDISLAAPGERGAFLRREGWADRAYDWERAAFSWLFSDGGQDAPVALQAVFFGCTLIVSYLEPGDDDTARRFEERLRGIAPRAGAVFCPSRPPAGHGEGIGQWLARAAVGFCSRYGFLPNGFSIDLDGLAAARIRMDEEADPVPCVRPYAVFHPGSGSPAKNWPLDRYIELGKRLSAAGPGGMRVLVTSGEADGRLGELLAAAVSGAVHIHHPAIEYLARILASATLYVGNDSGVSHLAAAVQNAAGRFPEEIVLFGPSDAHVWAPPGAHIIDAGSDMQAASARDVLTLAERLVSRF